MKNPLAHYVRSRLHRRIFVWFGATILLTGIIVGAVMGVTTGGEGWAKEITRARTFIASRFEHAWDDPSERAELTRAIGTELDLDLRVTDAEGALLADIGRCDKPTWRVPVTRGGEALGQVAVCLDRHHFSSAKLILGLALAGTIMWACSGWIARRLARPIAEVARVADAIGSGKLETRVRTGRGHHRHGEVAALATAINTMATRIEKQFQDQKELLAGVSHEIRTPLARIRLLLELAREKGVDDESLTEVDREIIEMDALVSELLASSRLDFAALTPSDLDPAEAARRALQREGAPAEALLVETNATVRADATLVARALSNLVQNAKTHGGGLTVLKVRADEAFVTFTAEDNGPGFAEDEAVRIFEPFYRGRETRDRGSLGLGLALVRRIAEAHGGKAFAGARPGGGARIGFTLARRP